LLLRPAVISNANGGIFEILILCNVISEYREGLIVVFVLENLQF